MVQRRDGMTWQGMMMCDNVRTDSMTMQSMIRQERTVWRYNVKPVLRRHTRQYDGTMWRCDDGRYDNAIDVTTRCCNGRTVVRWETMWRTIWWRVWQRGWWSMMVEVEANLSLFVKFNPPCCTWLNSWLPCDLRSHAIACNVAEITCNCMRCRRDCMQLHAMSLRSHAIACNVMQSWKKTFRSSTVWVLENTPGTRSGTESLPEEFLHNNCEQIYYHYFFRLSQKRRNEKRDSIYTGNVFLPGRNMWKFQPIQIFW